MHTFLQQVTSHILANYGNDFGRLCIILPNRRAGLYLNKYLSQHLNRPAWAPQIFSIEDFFIHLSGLSLADRYELLFLIYEIHREIEAENAEPFHDFMKWAPMMVSDFSEIDSQLLDARYLFSYLTEAKAIERWNPGKTSLTPAEKKYLDFFRSMIVYYERLNMQLLHKGQGYQGMIARKVATGIERSAEQIRWQHLIFAGFNALTNAEKRVIDVLVGTGKAEVIWDADSYYMDDERQEAGLFLREIRKASQPGSFLWTGNWFRDITKDIRITGVPKQVRQVKVAAGILQDWLDENADLTDTAVVLADENLLLPLLNSLPPGIKSFNVTMGLPAGSTSLFQFISQVLRLYENEERFSQMNRQANGGYYFRDILKILKHPYLRLFTDTSRLTDTFRKSNRVLYSYANICGMAKEHLQIPEPVIILFENQHPAPGIIMEIINRMILFFRDNLVLMKNSDSAPVNIDIELEYLYHLALIINRVSSLIAKFKAVDSARTLRSLFNTVIIGARIPFYGEPLSGLQIMGLLETRCLDFRRVILLSANEGILPPAKSHNSFIPFDIRMEYGLPVVTEENAMFAYNFYRLIQRSSLVHLIYNTEPDILAGGEQSRFISQLLREMPAYQAKTKFVQITDSLMPEQGVPRRSITIEKDEIVLGRLLGKATSGLSPTSLNRYRSCPLQFYFSDIAGLEEAEAVEETLENRTIGTLVHDVLEKLYRPYLNKVLLPVDIDRMKGVLDEQLKKSFDIHYQGGELGFGRNRLIYEVIRKYLVSFLAYEKELLSIQPTAPVLVVTDLEKTIKVMFPAGNDHDIDVCLKGTIDRIDSVDGRIRIIDYKTGMVKESGDVVIESWDDLAGSNKFGKAFQVIMYAWLFHRQHVNASQGFEAGLISMRSLSSGLISFGIKTEPRGPKDSLVDTEKLENFENILRDLINEILDRKVPFRQTADVEVCRLCDFTDICNKKKNPEI